MYHLNFIEYSVEGNAEEYLKSFNETPATTATITGEMGGTIEIEVQIKYEADSPFNAILQGQKLAEDYGADIYSITRTEQIATEEILNQ